MKIYTSRFQNKSLDNSAFSPVRISRGAPRWKIAYKIEASIPGLAPAREMADLPETAFRKKYRAQLEAVGVEAIEAEFLRIDRGLPIVLLCFCDLDTQFCHRRIFAEWWQERTGQRVAEL